jgi:O-antigen/teichoic acid export membrane protein
MSARSRLVKGFGATAVGPLITALVQLVSVPVFLRAWGAELYGEWLVISAIPIYLSVTDVGFGSVAGNDMAIRIARADREGALATFQSTLLLVSGMSFLIAGIAMAYILGAPLANSLNIVAIDARQARVVLMLLSIYALCTLHGSLLLSAFRSDGQYALGVSGLNAVRLVENLVSLIVLWQGGQPVSVAVSLTLVRFGGTLLLYTLLLNKLPWIKLSVSHASWSRVRQLSRPALAFTAFPAGNALSIQGMTVLMGMVLGPVAVATFTPMRTLSRVTFQVVDAIKNTVWPELSAAYGAQNWLLARRLHRSCCQIALWFSIIAVLGLALAGPTLFRLWTHQHVTLDLACFQTLLVVTIASSLWNTSSAVSIAANLHGRLAIQYLAGTLGALALAYVLLPRFHMLGAALALLAADLWMAWFVVRESNELLMDDTRDFVRAIVTLNKLKLLFA